MGKADERRAALVAQLADFVLEQGLVAASLRPLAAAAGTSARMLLYYFEDKSELIAAILGQIAGRLQERLSAMMARKPLGFEALLRRLRGVLLEPEFWPYMCLWLEIAARSAREESSGTDRHSEQAAEAGAVSYRALGEQIARGFHEWAAAQLDGSTPAARRREAARLLATIEGFVLLRAVGLNDVVDQA